MVSFGYCTFIAKPKKRKSAKDRGIPLLEGYFKLNFRVEVKWYLLLYLVGACSSVPVNRAFALDLLITHIEGKIFTWEYLRRYSFKVITPYVL